MVGLKVIASGMTSKKPSERVRVALAAPAAVLLGIVRLRRLVDCTEILVALRELGDAGGAPTNRFSPKSWENPTPFRVAWVGEDMLAKVGCTRKGPGRGSFRDVGELMSKNPTHPNPSPKSMLVSSIVNVVIHCPEKGSKAPNEKQGTRPATEKVLVSITVATAPELPTPIP
jgi:hypothetical protein